MENEELGFMRKICDEPAEDLHRLVVADYLDEKAQNLPATRVKCTAGGCGHKCKPGYRVVNSGRNYKWGEPREKVCPTCNGEGTVIQPSLPAVRAEYIRVQVKLPTLKCTGVMNPCINRVKPHLMCPDCQELRKLRPRERELWNLIRWNLGPLLPRGNVAGHDSPHHVSWEWRPADFQRARITLQFRRGFPDCIAVDGNEWLEVSRHLVAGDGSSRFIQPITRVYFWAWPKYFNRDALGTWSGMPGARFRHRKQVKLACEERWPGIEFDVPKYESWYENVVGRPYPEYAQYYAEED